MSQSFPINSWEDLHRVCGELRLNGIPFPALPILLPSVKDLVILELYNIPETGYISPEVLVTGLATLTKLRDLSIGFRSPNSHPERVCLPPTARTVLPVLTSFEFQGDYGYLEHFAARIDAPQLHVITICYLNQLVNVVNIDVPQLSRIVDHSEALKRPLCCCVTLRPESISFIAFPGHPHKFDVPRPPLDIAFCIVCKGIDWQVSRLTQTLSQISAVPSNVVHLTLQSDFNPISPILNNVDDIEWLQLLNLFSSVRTLFLGEQLAWHVSHALQVIDDGMMATELLPALDTLCVEGQFASSVEKFIAARRDSGRSVTFVNTETEFRERLNSPTSMK